MRKFIFIVFSVLTGFFLSAQELSYYLPDSVQYNPAIPKPKEIIYHNVGEYHVTHDRLVGYMQALAKAAPDRIKLENIGATYEGRPQILLIITSPKNHQNLEQIRQQHVQLTDPSKSAALNTDNMPVVLYIGHSIHGNEPSGANAALLSAYYLAAGQGASIEDLLNNVVILFDPSFNPDGLQRFSTWVNQHRSKNLVTDPNSREFNEVWPGGRFNHYWFDLNRDWLPAQHVESQNRLKWFHLWKPNILTDHHEQGSNATFFFQPGVPSRVNPLTPLKNQELTGKMAKYHARALDRIGSLYFTKENYDDFYYGKGSTYPDVNGAIGILFEQASSRGHAQQTANGVLRFPFTIKNQFTTTLSTLEAAKNLRKEFLDWQREFYRTAGGEAASFPTKAYVFGDAADEARTEMFVTMLRRHQIDVYSLGASYKAEDIEFKKNNAYIVPLNQPQTRLIRGIFEKTLAYADSIFYDITAWTMPLAFGLPYAELTASQYSQSLAGEKVTGDKILTGNLTGKSKIAYLMEWPQFYAPAALYELQNAGIVAKVATNTFEMTVDNASKKYNYGTVLIPVSLQTLNADQLYAQLKTVADKYNITVTAVQAGSVTGGSDLGSAKFSVLTKPSIAMLAGTGVNATDAGEIWHLLDQRFNIPLTHLEVPVFNRVDLSKYNTLIMVGGTGYNEINKEKLRTWIQGGGTLILTEEAVTWAAQAGISSVVLKRQKSGVDSARQFRYTDREQMEGGQAMSGVILRAEADLSHPLAYGYSQPYISLFKANKVYMERAKSPFATPFYYKDKPLQSGWLSKENYEAAKNSAAVVVNAVGNGKIISIADNPNFRAFWLGGTKLMMNSIFFGRNIEAGSARTGEE